MQHHHLRQLKWGSSEDMENVSQMDQWAHVCLLVPVGALLAFEPLQKPHKG